MRRLRTVWISAAGVLVSVFALRFIEYPDSLFVCLSVMLAVEVVSSMLRMCDRLLDPAPAIFLVFCRHDNNFSRLLHMP